MVTDNEMIARHAAQIDEVMAARLRKRKPVKVCEMITHWIDGEVTRVYDDFESLLERADYMIRYTAVRKIEIPAIGYVAVHSPK